MEWEPMFTPREKSPLRKNSPQRRIEPVMLHQAGQWAQHAVNKLFWPQHGYFCCCVHPATGWAEWVFQLLFTLSLILACLVIRSAHCTLVYCWATEWILLLLSALVFGESQAVSRRLVLLSNTGSVERYYCNFRTISRDFFSQLLTPRLEQRMRLIYGFFFWIRRASHPCLFLASFQLTSKRSAAIWRCLCSVLFISKVSQKFVSIFKNSVEWSIHSNFWP